MGEFKCGLLTRKFRHLVAPMKTSSVSEEFTIPFIAFASLNVSILDILYSIHIYLPKVFWFMIYSYRHAVIYHCPIDREDWIYLPRGCYIPKVAGKRILKRRSCAFGAFGFPSPNFIWLLCRKVVEWPKTSKTRKFIENHGNNVI